MSSLIAPDRRALSEVFKDPRTLRAFEALFQTSAATAAGGSAISVLPSGAGNAGDFVNVYNNAGALGVRQADATDIAKAANGFILQPMVVGTAAVVYFAGLNTAAVPTSPGQVWLSETVPGGFQTTPPPDSASGHLNQLLGVAVPGVGIAFQTYPAYPL